MRRLTGAIPSSSPVYDVAMVTVTNKSRRPFEVNLHAGVDYGFEHGSEFSMEQETTLDDGTKGTLLIERTLPGSLSFAPGETREGLPDAILRIHEFRAARDAGILRVVQTS